MNDAHDNAQTDRVMLERFLDRSDPLDTSLDEACTCEDLDEDEVTATIQSSMSDLEIVNKIIRVAGYKRIDIISDMLEDRLINSGLRNER